MCADTNLFTVFDARISQTFPDMSELCTGCNMLLIASGQPGNRPVVWSIVTDGTGAATLANTNNYSAELIVGSGAVDGITVVRAADRVYQTCYDEKVIHTFVAPTDAPLNGAGLNPAEQAWVAAHPVCAALMNSDALIPGAGNIREWAEAAVAAAFPSGCDGFSANGEVRNAFLHAWANCYMSRSCGANIAEEYWNAHEQEENNMCGWASQDLHNNAVGREAAAGQGDCADALLDAVRQGKMRWQQDPGNDCDFEGSLDPSDPCYPPP